MTRSRRLLLYPVKWTHTRLLLHSVWYGVTSLAAVNFNLIARLLLLLNAQCYVVRCGGALAAAADNTPLVASNLVQQRWDIEWSCQLMMLSMCCHHHLDVTNRVTCGGPSEWFQVTLKRPFIVSTNATHVMWCVPVTGGSTWTRSLLKAHQWQLSSCIKLTGHVWRPCSAQFNEDIPYSRKISERGR